MTLLQFWPIAAQGRKSRIASPPMASEGSRPAGPIAATLAAHANETMRADAANPTSSAIAKPSRPAASVSLGYSRMMLDCPSDSVNTRHCISCAVEDKDIRVSGVRMVRCVPMKTASRIEVGDENARRNRSRRLRRNQPLRAGIHGSRAQGHSRAPDRRSARRPPQGRPDRGRAAPGQVAAGRKRAETCSNKCGRTRSKRRGR